MTRHLPPLNQLRVFEAVARHLSFKDAAEELNVTHSAVSQQIKALEDSLDLQLFQRTPGGIQMTEATRNLSLDVTRALDLMNTAINRYKSNDKGGTLRISVVPWYGYRYLVPNLSKFHSMHSNLNIDLHFSYDVVDFQKDDFHAAMRHGLGNWDNLTAYRLHNDCMSPVCVPSLVAGLTRPLSPEQISSMDLALVRNQEVNWYTWLTEVGITEHDNINFIEFENRALATEFALAGNGVALSDRLATMREIHSGQLICLHPHTVRVETGMHLVFPESQYPDPRMKVIADWIITCFETTEKPEVQTDEIGNTLDLVVNRHRPQLQDSGEPIPGSKTGPNSGQQK